MAIPNDKKCLLQFGKPSPRGQSWSWNHWSSFQALSSSVTKFPEDFEVKFHKFYCMYCIFTVQVCLRCVNTLVASLSNLFRRLSRVRDVQYCTVEYICTKQWICLYTVRDMSSQSDVLGMDVKYEINLGTLPDVSRTCTSDSRTDANALEGVFLRGGVESEGMIEDAHGGKGVCDRCNVAWGLMKTHQALARL